jgi:hypothetical protein
MNRIFKPFVFVLAAIYFVLDAAFLTVAMPIARQLARVRTFDNLRARIVSLRPYPTLALFIVPVAILEPAKPLAAYLTATHHVTSGLTVLVVSEILKLVLIERLFSVSRDKLMSIRAFAWCYGKLRQAHDWIESLKAWRRVRRFILIVKRSIRSYVVEMKTSQKQRRLSLQAH